MVKKGKSKKIQKKFEKRLLADKGIANEELGKAFRDLRSSNAAVPHVPKRDKGSRSVKNNKAIKDSLS